MLAWQVKWANDFSVPVLESQEEEADEEGGRQGGGCPEDRWDRTDGWALQCISSFREGWRCPSVLPWSETEELAQLGRVKTTLAGVRGHVSTGLESRGSEGWER